MTVEIVSLSVGLFFVGLFLWKNRASKRPFVETVVLMEKRHQGWVNLREGRIAYFDSLLENPDSNLSEKVPWVFIHSIGSSSFSWRYQWDEFWAKERLITIDLLGFGSSDKPPEADYGLEATGRRVLECLDELKVKACYLVGCSLGGALSLWLQTQAPDKILKVVAIAPAGTPKVVPFLKIPHHRLAPLGRKIVSRALIRAALMGGLAHRERLGREVVENYYRPFQNPDAVTCFLKSVSLIKDQRVFDQLSKVSCPTLLLWGERDRVVPRWAMEDMLAQNSSLSYLSHPEGGHHLMEDEPQWTNRALADFLGSHSDVQSHTGQKLMTFF